EDVLKPLIDTKNGIFKIYKGTYIYHGNIRIKLEDDSTLDVSDGEGSVMQNIFINTKTQSLKVFDGRDQMERVEEQDILLASLVWDSNDHDKLVSVFMTCEYNVQGQLHPGVIAQPHLAVFNTADVVDRPNIDLENKEITFYGPFRLSLGNKVYRHLGSYGDVVVNYSEGSAYISVLFDFDTGEFSAIGANVFDGIKNSESTVMTINFNWINQMLVNSVLITNYYTLNGYSMSLSEYTLFQKGSNSQLPEINTIEKKLKFYGTNYLYFRKNRKTIKDLELDLTRGGSQYGINQF